MNRRSIVTILLAILSVGVFLFTANEYLKLVEKKTIEAYLESLKDEFQEHSKSMTYTPVVCSGVIQRICTLEEARIFDDNIEVALERISIMITHVSYDKIGMRSSIERIKHNMSENPHLIFLPNKFIYSFELIKQDSALGYVALHRAISLEFDKFDVDLQLNILLRGQSYRNKNILFLTKEWFDSTTPSFYEYSLDKLNVRMKGNDIGSYYTSHFKTFDVSLLDVVNEFKTNFKQNKFTSKLATSYFDDFLRSAYKLLSGSTHEINLSVRRKKQDLVFFNHLDDEAATKKAVEIAQILNSIDATYQVELQVE